MTDKKDRKDTAAFVRQKPEPVGSVFCSLSCSGSSLVQKKLENFCNHGLGRHLLHRCVRSQLAGLSSPSICSLSCSGSTSLSSSAAWLEGGYVEQPLGTLLGHILHRCVRSPLFRPSGRNKGSLSCLGSSQIPESSLNSESGEQAKRDTLYTAAFVPVQEDLAVSLACLSLAWVPGPSSGAAWLSRRV